MTKLAHAGVQLREFGFSSVRNCNRVEIGTILANFIPADKSNLSNMCRLPMASYSGDLFPHDTNRPELLR